MTAIYQKGQELSFEQAGQPPKVLGDPIMLLWMVTNLIENASVHAGGGHTYKGSIDIHIAEEAGRAVLTVSDHGVGVAPETLGQLTERFYRHNPQTPGSGLGLAIVEQVATAHAATLSLYNRADHGPPNASGLVARLEFPARAPAPPGAPSRAS